MNATLNEPTAAELDARAVAAIRQGDRERYRELVERYEQKVYAVAWCRLGNPDWAREATQEAFIKGYHQLPWLSQGGKFAAWIMAIARHAAINLGIRQRNDLKKHARWALDQAPAEPPAAGETFREPDLTGTTLSAALAELPAGHRESLVLFYLEGRSIVEAATALGISETAFKTRLHRARAALREELETGLGESLGRLRPRHALAPGIMALLAAGRAEAAVAGTGLAVKLAAVAGKVLPLGWLGGLAGLLGVVPGALLAWWVGRLEGRNFREPEGFRAQRQRAALREGLAWLPVVVLVIFALTWLGFQRHGLAVYCRAAGLVFLLWWGAVAGPAWRVRNPYLMWQYFATGLLVLGFLGVGFAGLPWWSLSLFQVLFFLGCAGSFRYEPNRFDYSLFLRAREGMLPPAEPVGPPHPARFTRPELLALARFLGRRQLIINYRWGRAGLQFRLPQTRPGTVRDRSLPFLWRGLSTVTVGWDGAIHADLGAADARDLLGPAADAGDGAARWSAQVATALRAALDACLVGDTSRAEAVLGQTTELSIFHQPPARSASRRLRLAVLAVAVPILLLGVAASWWFSQPRSALPPVTTSEPRIRAALAAPHGIRWEALSSPTENRFWLLDTLPPKSQLPANVWAGLRDDLWHEALNGAWVPTNGLRNTAALRSNVALQRALRSGLFTLTDFAGWGVTPATVRADLVALPLEFQSPWLELRPTPLADPAHPDQPPNQSLPVGRALWFQTLARFDALDLVDRDAFIATLRACQVLPRNSPAGYSPLANPAAVTGLFHCVYNRPLEDTYDTLVLLDLFHALDTIDRAECVRGLLRFHRARGWFGPLPETPDLYFPGDARDTFYAFESLRLLHALDQVKDLDRWQFRPGEPAISTADAVNWFEVEAWLWQHRLNRYLAQRRRDPSISAPALGEPFAGW